MKKTRKETLTKIDGAIVEVYWAGFNAAIVLRQSGRTSDDYLDSGDARRDVRKLVGSIMGQIYKLPPNNGVQPTAPVSKRKSRSSTSRKSSKVRGG